MPFSTTNIRDLLYKPVQVLGLPPYLERRVLAMAANTVGDLVMMTELFFANHTGISYRSVETVNEKLASYGLEFRPWNTNAAREAIRIYGGAEYIPAPMMSHWQNGLKPEINRFLRSFGGPQQPHTLGALCELRFDEFKLDGRLISNAQRIVIKQGVEHVGLSLRK